MHLSGNIDPRTGIAGASLKILDKDGSVCFVNMAQSCQGDSLLSSFVTRCHGEIIDIPATGAYQRYSDLDWTFKYRLFGLDQAENVVCGSVLADVAAVTLFGGHMVIFSFSDGSQEVQAQTMRVSGPIPSGGRSAGLDLLQKWFVGGDSSGSDGREDGVPELLSIELTMEQRVISVTDTGVIRVHNCLSGVSLCELDILRSLVEDYDVVPGAASLSEALVTAGTGGLFSVGLCIKVESQDGNEHLEWHVVVLQLSEQGGLSWKLVDFSEAHPNVSRLALRDLSLSPGTSNNEDPNYALLAKWGDEKSTILFLVGFSSVEKGRSLALLCSLCVLDAESECNGLLQDELLGDIVRKKGGWQVGFKRELTSHEAKTALKMTRLQRIFTPGRFSLPVIIACLQNDVPVPFDDKFLRVQGLSIAAAVQTVCSMCECWAQERLCSEGNDFERDEGHTGILDYLDLSFLDFTRLCHLRHLAIDAKTGCKASWADLSVAASLVPPNYNVLLPDVRGFSLLSLPRGVLHEQKPLVYTGKDVEGFLDEQERESNSRAPLKVLQRVQDAISERSIVEFEFNFTQLCMQSSEFDTDTMRWLSEQGASLASQLVTDNSLNAELEALARDSSLLTAVSDFVSNEDFAPVDLRRASNECTTSSSFRCSLLADIAARYVKRQYRRSCTLLVVLCFLSNRQSLLSASTNSVLQTRFLPMAIHNTAYYGLLQWLGSVRPTDATDLRRLFDLDDLFPNSKALSERNVSARNYLESSMSNESVLRNFWKYLDDHGQALTVSMALEDVIKGCARSLRPSCMGDFCRYLLHEGQFPALRKVSSLLMMRLSSLEESIAEHASSSTLALAKFGRNLQLHRILTLGGVAHFYELLRMQVSKSRSGQLISEADDVMIKNALERLLEASIEPPSAVSSIPTGNLSRQETEEMSPRESIIEVILQWNIPGLQECFPALSTLGASDIVGCVRDTLERVVDENEVLVHLIGSGSESGADLTKVLLDHTAFVEQIISISHVRDVLELLKRARVALRHDTGASMSLHGGYMLMRMVKGTIENFADLMDDSAPIGNTLTADLMTAWGRIFNSALESHSLDQALSAVVRMVELEETLPLEYTAVAEMAPEKSVTQPWQACLRSLVTLACESGNLEWLCNMPEIKIGLVLMTECVCAELSRLAKTRGYSNALYPTATTSTSSSSPVGMINYAECLLCFHVTRASFREASRAMFTLANRGRVTNPGSREAAREGEGVTSTALRSQSLAVSICNLRLCDSRQAYLISHAANGMSLECVTLDLMVTQLLRLRANYLSKLPSFTPSNDTVEALCALRRWTHAFAAMQLSAQELRLAASPDSPSALQCNPRAKQLLCKAIAALAELSVSPEASLQYREIDMIAPFSHPCDPIGVPSDPYRLLVDSLRALDSADINWMLHRSAVDTLLSLNPAHALPAALCDSFGVDKSFGRRPGASTSLLRELFGKGHLSEACQMASLMLGQSIDAKLVNMPYEVLDDILCASRKTVETFNAVSNTDKVALETLQADLSRLETELTKYFAHTVGQ